jgi:hypothetical protein
MAQPRPATHTLDVPGARLHYEVRGSGPLLPLVGACSAPPRTTVPTSPR